MNHEKCGKNKCPSAQKYQSHTQHTTTTTTDHDETQIIGQAVLGTAYNITAYNRHLTKTNAAFGWTKETATSDGDRENSNHQKYCCREY
jgi:hypothetical protein